MPVFVTPPGGREEGTVSISVFVTPPRGREGNSFDIRLSHASGEIERGTASMPVFVWR